jgi:CCR4-NOT transcription complex subunit 3
MERFKASEKELKTKAFSKEGLIAASRLDPAEKAKLELSQWLSSMVDELARQVETTEAEVEQLAGGTKKKKGGASNERAAQLDQLNERRNWHSSRLEILLRMLENGTLETERVADIKDDIKYFVESNADEDFEEDEGIYDDFNLDEEEEAFGLKDNDDMTSHDAISIPDGE